MSEDASSLSRGPTGRPKTRSVLPYKPSFYGNIGLALGWYKLYEAEGRLMKKFQELNAILNLVENDPEHRIKVSQELVQTFRKWYLGPVGDGLPSFRDLKPYDRKEDKGYFMIGRPVPIADAWAGYDPTFVAFQAGFSIPIQNPDGSTTREPIKIKGSEYTNCVSISWWNTRFSRLLRELEPLGAAIEIHIAKVLEEQGIEVMMRGVEDVEEEAPEQGDRVE